MVAADAYSFDINGIQPISSDGLFSTYSTDSLPQGKYAFQATIERSTEPDYYRLQLNGAYGLGSSIDLYLSIPYVYSFRDSIDGLEDISFGMKHRFYDEGKYGPSLAYLLSASLPTGRRQLSTDGKIGAGIILSKRIGPFRGSFNLIYEKPARDSLQDELLFASGIDLAATHSSFILAEFIAKRGFYSGEYNHLEARIGYRLKTTESIYTTFGIGTDLQNRSPEYRMFFAVSYTNAADRKKPRKIYEEE